MRAFLWLVGLVLLVGSIVGAKWVLDNNSTDAKNNGPSSRKADDVLPPEVACIGIIDTEVGSRDLYPSQLGRVVEIVETKTKDGKDRLFKEGDVLLRVDDSAPRFTLGKAKAASSEAEIELEKAKLLPAKHDFDLKQQQVGIAAAKAELAKAEADFTLNKRKFIDSVSDQTKLIDAAFEKAKELLGEKIKLENFKLEQLGLFNPQFEMDRAKANLDAKRGDEKLAQKAVEDCELKAPVAGTVLRVHAKIGEALGPNPRSPALEFLDDTPRIVRAEVLQEWSRLVKVGQAATIIDDTYREEKWEGRVRNISDWILPKRLRIIEPFMTNDVRTMECIVEFTNPPRVLIGQRVRVKIDIK